MGLLALMKKHTKQWSTQLNDWPDTSKADSLSRLFIFSIVANNEQEHELETSSNATGFLSRLSAN